MVNISSINGMVYITPEPSKPLVPPVGKAEAMDDERHKFDEQLQKFVDGKPDLASSSRKKHQEKPFYKVDEENLVTKKQLEDFKNTDLSSAETVFSKPSVMLKPQTDKLLRHVVALSDLMDGKEVPAELVDRKLMAFNVENARQAVFDFTVKTQGKGESEVLGQAKGLNILSAIMKSSFELEQFKGQAPETGFTRA